MRLLIIAAGRFDRGPEAALYAHYAERFHPLASRLGLEPLTLQEIVPRARQSEAQALAAALPGGAHVVALDASGRARTSETLAREVAAWRDRGVRTLAFLIGGADGLGAARELAQDSLSLGPQTWPHLLVRGMLAEQLYRSATILLHHPYHRGATGPSGKAAAGSGQVDSAKASR